MPLPDDPPQEEILRGAESTLAFTALSWTGWLLRSQTPRSRACCWVRLQP